MSERKRILLVEDSAPDRELILAALGEHALAHEVAVARDGAEALDYLRRGGAFARHPAGNPVVVLLDLKMPKRDGLEVLRAIRAEEGLKTVPVVMLTSSNEERDRRESYEAGANAYVVKPLEFSQLVQALGDVGLLWAASQPLPVSTEGRP